jgi:ribosome-binding protein aMBF1 (putative translation factor)
MKQRLIKADTLHKKWMEDPGYAAAYAALEGEFSIASALIKARSDAGLTQEALAKRMGTTQTVIARLESGRALPSTRTLAKLADATGHRLRIAFEAVEQPRKRGAA